MQLCIHDGLVADLAVENAFVEHYPEQWWFAPGQDFLAGQARLDELICLLVGRVRASRQNSTGIILGLQ